MTQIIQLGQPPIDVTIRQSPRARRLSLRISGLDGKVSLTVPRAGSMRAARVFLQEKEGWIRKHLGAQPELVEITHGTALPIEGQIRRIVPGTARAVQLGPQHVEIPGKPEQAGTKLRGFLKTLARDRLAEASVRHAQALGQDFRKITLRDTRSRWGSCTSDANLMYSWRLILAPPEVLDYVAAHEVAHLAEMNHSPRFWAEVARLMPGFEPHRKWLKTNGAELHRYCF